MRHLFTVLGLALLMMSQGLAPAVACDEQLIDRRQLQPAMQRYFGQLTKAAWEGVQPFEWLEGERIYLSADFDRLDLRQKRSVLSLLLLDYGAYRPLLQLLPEQRRKQLERLGGAMAPYEVYTHDGRLVSLPYNACNRMTLLTEYERSRMRFLGIRQPRSQRFPMSRWQEEQVKKLFWQHVGYQRAGDYWLAWVPESGHFEIDVPSLNHGEVLGEFLQAAPPFYRYVVVDRGRRIYSIHRGRRLDG